MNPETATKTLEYSLEDIEMLTPEELREYAKQLGLKFNPKIGDEKLKKLIRSVLDPEDDETPEEPDKPEKGVTVTLLRPHPHTVAGIRIDGEYTLTKEQAADPYITKRLRKAEAKGQIKVSWK